MVLPPCDKLSFSGSAKDFSAVVYFPRARPDKSSSFYLQTSRWVSSLYSDQEFSG
jgi:hypothetical protein